MSCNDQSFEAEKTSWLPVFLMKQRRHGGTCARPPGHSRAAPLADTRERCRQCSKPAPVDKYTVLCKLFTSSPANQGEEERKRERDRIEQRAPANLQTACCVTIAGQTQPDNSSSRDSLSRDNWRDLRVAWRHTF